MMSRSHVLIGLAGAGVAMASGFLPVRFEILAGAAIGSLAPDIDTPYSVLGRLLPFLSHPIYRTAGHRTATHSAIGVLCGIVLALLAETHVGAGTGQAFLLGYVLHIGADLMTVEGVVLFWPVRRRRVRVWPAVRTGGSGEGLMLGAFLLAAASVGYAYHPALTVALGIPPG